MDEQMRVGAGMGGQGEDKPGRSKKLQNDPTGKQHIQKTSRKEETLCSLTALTFEVHSPISTLFYNSPKPTFPAYDTWIQLKARTPL